MRASQFATVFCALLFCNFLHAQVFVDFTMDKTGGYSPVTINFTNLTSGASANAKYSWDFGNGNMSFSTGGGEEHQQRRKK